MKKVELITLHNAIQAAIALKNSSAKFRYGVRRNRDYILPEITCLKEIEEGYAETIKEFTEERNSLILKFGKKDEKGMVFLSPEDTENFEKFRTELKPLQEKYKDEIAEFDANMAEYSKTILEEELDENPKVFEISIDEVPADLPDEIMDIFYNHNIIK